MIRPPVVLNRLSLISPRFEVFCTLVYPVSGWLGRVVAIAPSRAPSHIATKSPNHPSLVQLDPPRLIATLVSRDISVRSDPLYEILEYLTL